MSLRLKYRLIFIIITIPGNLSTEQSRPLFLRLIIIFRQNHLLNDMNKIKPWEPRNQQERCLSHTTPPSSIRALVVSLTHSFQQTWSAQSYFTLISFIIVHIEMWRKQLYITFSYLIVTVSKRGIRPTWIIVNHTLSLCVISYGVITFEFYVCFR